VSNNYFTITDFHLECRGFYHRSGEIKESEKWK